ncbi:unnamed protein product [Musa acuminata subsp. malaccensis]|uniref:(wild Malaysian banana) hypothetical protein n=1 Tax=Musa acuminata subsp. malaccensis TaxID=214687 RepID=A0A8D7B683_MUSAM|nr:unnamed protein product [Musa acuminata subsp. malaccensis]
MGSFVVSKRQYIFIQVHGFEIFKYERNLRFLMIFNMALISHEDITLHT